MNGSACLAASGSPTRATRCRCCGDWACTSGRTTRLNDFSRHRLAGAELHPNSVQLLADYKAWLARRNLLDYDDLVIRAAQLLELPDVQEAVAGRWDAVLVDECQDLNPVQYAVIKRLAEGHRNLFAVGDDEQSIFSWAGAVPRGPARPDERLRHQVGRSCWRRTGASARGIFETARRLLRAQSHACSRRPCAPPVSRRTAWR